MDSKFLNRTKTFEDEQMDIIKGNISNADEVLKTEAEVKLEEEVPKGS